MSVLEPNLITRSRDTLCQSCKFGQCQHLPLPIELNTSTGTVYVCIAPLSSYSI